METSDHSTDRVPKLLYFEQPYQASSYLSIHPYHLNRRPGLRSLTSDYISVGVSLPYDVGASSTATYTECVTQSRRVSYRSLTFRLVRLQRCIGPKMAGETSDPEELENDQKKPAI